MSGSPSGLRPYLPLRSLLPAGPLHACGRPRGSGGQGHPTFLSAVAAIKRATDVADHALRDQEECTSRRRPHNLYPARPIQPVALAPDLVALGSAWCSAASNKRTFEVCQNRTLRTCANTPAANERRGPTDADPAAQAAIDRVP